MCDRAACEKHEVDKNEREKNWFPVAQSSPPS
jgi:hypothetical protein